MHLQTKYIVLKNIEFSNQLWLDSEIILVQSMFCSLQTLLQNKTF